MSESEVIWECPRCGGPISADDVDVRFGDDGLFGVAVIHVCVACPTCHYERLGMIEEADLVAIDEDEFADDLDREDRP